MLKRWFCPIKENNTRISMVSNSIHTRYRIQFPSSKNPLKISSSHQSSNPRNTPTTTKVQARTIAWIYSSDNSWTTNQSHWWKDRSKSSREENLCNFDRRKEEIDMLRWRLVMIMGRYSLRRKAGQISHFIRRIREGMRIKKELFSLILGRRRGFLRKWLHK